MIFPPFFFQDNVGDRYLAVMATCHHPSRSTTSGPSSQHCQPAVPATTCTVGALTKLGISDPSKINNHHFNRKQQLIFIYRLVVLKEWDERTHPQKEKFPSVRLPTGDVARRRWCEKPSVAQRRAPPRPFFQQDSGFRGNPDSRFLFKSDP